MQTISILWYVDHVPIQGSCYLEEIERERERHSFSRNGQLAPAKHRRLLLPSDIFKLKLQDHFTFQIEGELGPKYITQIIGDRVISGYNVPYKMLPVEFLWVTALI